MIYAETEERYKG